MAENDLTTITVDREARAVLVAALDLYMRVGLGQWDRVAEASAGVVDPLSRTVADELLDVRVRHASDGALRHPNASLAIHRAHRAAQVACDAWRTLGAGMPDRADDRLTDAVIALAGDVAVAGD